MTERKDLWHLVDQIENPTRRLRGAIEVLVKFKDAEDIPDHERDAIAFVTAGLDGSVTDLMQVVDELHKAVGGSGIDNARTPLQSV
jgi:hypothetical protein